MLRVFARHTIVTTIDFSLACDFVSQHHRQGVPRVSNAHCFGLFYQDALVGVVMFCPPRSRRKQREYKYELLRMCFPDGIRVVGGAGKLINAFIRKVNPPCFFTYQDSSGENTSVYERAGMRLVARAKNKKVVVRNGVTFAEATNNRRDWFSMEQVVRLGADNLLGVNLGEVFDGGRRLSNVEVFTDMLGYHLETIPGDNVYEWVSDNHSFYVYKITATNSDKYYIGRKTIPHPNVTVEKMENDGYWGSGGSKYQNWLKKHKTHARKEILHVCDTWAQSIRLEDQEIGDKYATDPLCLNSTSAYAGVVGSAYARARSVGWCDVHGEVSVDSYGCVNCRVSSSYVVKECVVHGESVHHGDSCVRCVSDVHTAYGDCVVHGRAVFQGKSCTKCRFIVKECVIHGMSKHTLLHGVCVRCSTPERVADGWCPVHGDVRLVGRACVRCSLGGVYDMGDCPLHGLVKFRKGSCVSCANSKNVSVSSVKCGAHGDLSLSVDGWCWACVVEDGSVSQFFGSQERVGNKHRFVCPDCGRKIWGSVNGFAQSAVRWWADKQAMNGWVSSVCRCNKKV